MLKIFNTMTRSKDEFHSIDSGIVRLYSCGPTVYSRAHIGNLRAYIFVDLLKRVLRKNNYAITHIMNITDVGHLTSDGDSGQDKMEKAAQERKETVWDIAKKFTDLFIGDIQALHIWEPNEYTRATDYIDAQIDLIKKLEEKGYTYRISDGVYFDTSKFPHYGDLARLDTDGLEAGSRVEFNPDKRNTTDFALWKFSNPNEHRQMEWSSPWGIGFPGWHIECSAMSMAKLGSHFDIHTGGVDHIPVHHPNEIAQSECATGKTYVNYWMHNEFILFNSEKMAKSIGNIYTLDDLKELSISPLAYKFFVLQTHYRKKLNVTTEAMKASAEGYKRVTDTIERIGTLPEENTLSELPTSLAQYKQLALDGANDDLNSPEIIANLFDAITEINSMIDKNTLPNKKTMSDFFEFFDQLLGLDLMKYFTITIPDNIKKIIQEREEAKKTKDFVRADSLREQAKQLGYEIQDTKQGGIAKKI